MWLFLASVLISLVHKVALGLGLGAATLALMLFVTGSSEDPLQKRFMGMTVYVLRIALALTIAVQLIFLSSVPKAQLGFVLREPVFLLNTLIVVVLLAAALAVVWRKIPDWLVAVLSGSSWYALFLLNTWPTPIPLTTGELTVVYAGFLLVFSGVIMALRKRFIPVLTIEPTP